MSELRVALIAEGPTDSVLIEAALKAILGRPFTLAPIQPEATRPQMGTGWCGVFKWCRALIAAAQGLPSLPCAQPCPPPAGAADELRKRVLAWLGLVQVGPRTVLCVPSKAIEAWLAAGVLEKTHPLSSGLERNLNLATQLAGLPKNQRINKGIKEYREHAGAVTREWARVTRTCTQAERFHSEVHAALGSGISPVPGSMAPARAR